jgi:hypothetical protein
LWRLCFILVYWFLDYYQNSIYELDIVEMSFYYGPMAEIEKRKQWVIKFKNWKFVVEIDKNLTDLYEIIWNKQRKVKFIWNILIDKQTHNEIK